MSHTASDEAAWLTFRVLLEGRGVEVEALPVTFFHTKLGEKLEFTGFSALTSSERDEDVGLTPLLVGIQLYLQFLPKTLSNV